MRKYLLLNLFIMILNCSYGQRISSQKVNYALKSRIDSVHNKIFRLAQSGKLPVYDFSDSILEPSKVFSDCISIDSVDCDSSKASISEFRKFKFKFKRGFNYKTLGFNQEIESINILYRFFFGGIELDGSEFYFCKINDLQRVLSAGDFEFLKFLGTSYCQNPYSQFNDSVVFSNGYKTLASMAFEMEESNYEEADFIKESLRNNLKFAILFDSIVINRISKVLFFQFDDEQLKHSKLKFYTDEKLNKEISKKDLYNNFFKIRYGTDSAELEKRSREHQGGYADTTISISNDRVYLKELTLFTNYCEVNFSIYPENQKVDLSGLMNKPFQTYFIDRKDLQEFLGEFQYLFLRNLFYF